MQAPPINLLIKVFSVKPVMARGSSLTQMEALDHQIIYSRIRTMLPRVLVVSSLKISNSLSKIPYSEIPLNPGTFSDKIASVSYSLNLRRVYSAQIPKGDKEVQAAYSVSLEESRSWRIKIFLEVRNRRRKKKEMLSSHDTEFYDYN